MGAMKGVHRAAIAILGFGAFVMFFLSGGVLTYRLSAGASLAMIFGPPLFVIAILYTLAWVIAGFRR